MMLLSLTSRVLWAQWIMAINQFCLGEIGHASHGYVVNHVVESFVNTGPVLSEPTDSSVNLLSPVGILERFSYQFFLVESHALFFILNRRSLCHVI